MKNETKKEEPKGIIIIAIFFLVIAFIALIFVFPLLIAGPGQNETTSGHFETLGKMLETIFIIAMSFTISGVGLLMFKRWGRLAAIIVTAIVSVIIIILAINNSTNFGSVVFFCICILCLMGVIYYLTRPKVKEWFK